MLCLLLSVSYLTSICIASEKKPASIADSTEVLTVIAPYLDWQSSCSMAQCSRKFRWAANTVHYVALTQGKIKPEDRVLKWMRCDDQSKLVSFSRKAYFSEDRPELVLSESELVRLDPCKETGHTGRFRVKEVNHQILDGEEVIEAGIDRIHCLNTPSKLVLLGKKQGRLMRSIQVANLNNGCLSFIPDDEEHPVLSFHWLTHELFLLIRQHGWYSIHSARAPIEPVFVSSSTQCRSEEFSKGAIFDADSLSEIWKNGTDFGIRKEPFETNVGPFFRPKCTVVNGIIEWERTGNEFE